MSIYLTYSPPPPIVPPPLSYSHLDLNPDFSRFESGFPQIVTVKTLMNICTQHIRWKFVWECMYVAFIFDMAVTILLLVNKDEEEKYI